MSGDPLTLHQLPQPLHSFISKFNLIATLEKELQDVPEDAINILSRKIYPVETLAPNIYSSLYRTLVNYFIIQSNRGSEYGTIAGDVIRFASHISDLLMNKMTEILKREDVKNRLLESCNKNNSNLSNVQSLQNGGSKKIAQKLIFDNISQKYSQESSNKYGHLLDDGFKRENKKGVTVENQDFGVTAEKDMKEKSGIENLINRISFEKELTKAGKIGNKKCLVCDNLVVLNKLNRNQLSKSTFKCIDCGEIFHSKCMQRENNCSFCQLSNINPLQKAKSPLFLGILKKGTKRHELEFEVSKCHANLELSEFSQKLTNDNSTMPSIELRSIRMKDKVDSVSNFINLFPDACSLMINTKLLREFEPLHKQSSLKYRRDECMKISSYLKIGSNKIVITERINKKDMKPDERIELDNHLVGVYIVENLQIPKSQDSHDNFTRFLTVIGSTRSSFEESESLLKESLFIKDKRPLCQIEEDQELVCDSVKVPLICSLTLQKMKFPGRTIFCKHFNCFDVENFILLNAQAKLPKWQCPICKASAYKFQIDCALSSLLSELDRLAKENMEQKNLKIKDNENVSEVVLNRNFELELFNVEGRILISKGSTKVKNAKISYLETEFVPFWIKRIYDLPIEGKNKREREREEKEERWISNKLDESVSVASEVNEKAAEKYNEEKIQKIIEGVEKNNIKPFIISLEELNRVILQEKEIQNNKEKHLKKSNLSNFGEEKQPLPFEVRILNFEQKQSKKKSQMKNENEEIEPKRKISKNDLPKNDLYIDSDMVDDSSFEANGQIRKLQFYDSSESCMKNFVERSVEEVGDENNKQKKVMEIEENKVMDECEQIEERESLFSLLFPSEIPKSDIHKVDEQMEKSFAWEQENCSDKMKKVEESGGELPKVINTQVFQGNDLPLEQEENRNNEDIKVDLKELLVAECLLGDKKESYFDESKNKMVSQSTNVVVNKDNTTFGKFKESEKKEIEGNSHNEIKGPRAYSPQTFENKKKLPKQKEKFYRILNNGFTSEKLDTSKNNEKMITRKRASKNAILPNSKVSRKERFEKDNFAVPNNADVIELSD